MLNTDDRGTIQAVRELWESTAESPKPIVFWIGAGVSKWAGYSLWGELSDQLHRDFSKYEPLYDTARGGELLSRGFLPDLFGLAKGTSIHRYHRFLKSQLAPREATPVYRRFVSALTAVKPVRVITTNVDEMLEHNLQGVETVQRTDADRALSLHAEGKSYLLKLHGSVSEIESAIFTREDYDAVWRDSPTSGILGALVSASSVVFLGYGLQDEEVVRLLEECHALQPNIGDGPHYILSPARPARLPTSIRVIGYTPVPHQDHRASLAIVEELAAARGTEKLPDRNSKSPDGLQSAHLLFDVFPPGTWNTSEMAETKSLETEASAHVVTGLGFREDELFSTRSTALNDLLVGLLCFDVVYAPFTSTVRLFRLLGEPLFMRLVRNGELRLIHWEQNLGVVFPSKDAVGPGKLRTISVHGEPNTAPSGPDVFLRRWMAPKAGKEGEHEQNIEAIVRATTVIAGRQEMHALGTTRSLLLSPRVRRMLGISGGTPFDSFTRWQAFPLLRLGYVVKVGAAANLLGLASVKLDFGSHQLAGPAFSASFGRDWAESVASYVLSGRFGEDLGAMAERDPGVFDAVLRFREQATGARLREEVLSQIAACAAADVHASVNAGLRQLVPTQTLEQARQALVRLFVSPHSHPRQSAVWNDERSSEKAISLWRDRSRREMRQLCSVLGAEPYGQCPCGSGEKLKFCCEEALLPRDLT